MNRILEVIDLEKKYGAFAALKGLSFSINQGEVIGILGPSGCGKSTLLQLISGLQVPDAGEIRLHGKTVSAHGFSVPPEERNMNMVFQDYALWPHMTVYDNIAYGLIRSKMKRADRDKKISELIQLLKLNNLEKRLPAQLSGGQQQRVAIARALATNPDLLLMDEPLSNLDKRLRIDMRTEMSYLFRQLNQSVVYVTHDPEEAFSLSDQLLIIRDGQLEQMDSPDKCFARPISKWAASLIGATNCLTGQNLLQEQSLATIRLGSDRIQAVYIPNTPLKPGTETDIMFRPEDVCVGTGGDTKNQFTVCTFHSMFEGSHWRILAETATKQRLAFFSSHHIPDSTTLTISINIEDTFAYVSAN